MAQLASEGTQASASLMSLCLKTLDGLSATLDLFTEVCCSMPAPMCGTGLTDHRAPAQLQPLCACGCR